jgi:hypothetical protein
MCVRTHANPPLAEVGLRQGDDDVAVALARTAHGPETVDHPGLKSDHALAALVGLVLVADATQRQGRGYGLERGWRDGDADHAADDMGRDVDGSNASSVRQKAAKPQ